MQTDEVTRFFANSLVLPVRPIWTREATSQYLAQMGWIGADVKTIKYWESEKKLWRTIPAFKNLTPKDTRGNYKRCYKFHPYQFWVVCKTSFVITQIRPYTIGTEYLDELIAPAIQHPEIQRSCLSPEVWRWEQNIAA